MAKSKHRKKHKQFKKNNNQQKAQQKASKNHRKKVMTAMFKEFAEYQKQQKLVQQDITVDNLINKIKRESSEEE